MKRDEVMAMTDDELRVKAAELMGWRFIGVLPVPGSLGESSYRTWEGEYGIVATIESDQPNLTKDNYLPDYPNDIAAAMELVEIAYSDGGLLFDVGRVHDEPTKWHADFFLLNPVCPGNETYNELSPFYRMLGGSPAQAITRAFILAMETE